MAKNYRAELVGVFGDPVEGNPTGVMEEAGFAALGLNWRYLTLKVTPADFDAAIRSLRPLHFRGINLTMPHKITVLPYLDQLSPAAQVIGAVNTVVVREDGLYGDNTDGRGFVEALRREGVSLAGQSVTLLGAGGAAKAIAVECALAGVQPDHRSQPEPATGRGAGPHPAGPYRRLRRLSALERLAGCPGGHRHSDQRHTGGNAPPRGGSSGSGLCLCPARHSGRRRGL